MKFLEWLSSFPPLFLSLISYYDDVFGYPQGRMLMLGFLLLGFGFWLGVLVLFS